MTNDPFRYRGGAPDRGLNFSNSVIADGVGFYTHRLSILTVSTVFLLRYRN
jgi:hypothetical protein